MCTQKKSVARSIIEQFNERAGSKVDIDRFFDRLDALGAVDDDSYSQLRWEDLEESGLPRLLARKVASEAFRVAPDAPQTITVVSDDPAVRAKRMTKKELLEHWNPRDNDDYADRLKQLSEGYRFLVYRDEDSMTLNVEASLELLEELGEDVQERTFYIVDGQPHRVYRVGERCATIKDEHPLYPDKTLVKGKSRMGLDWGKIELRCRQLLRLCVTQNVLRPEALHEADIYAMAEQGYEYLVQRYPEQAIELDRLIKLSKAPKLKVDSITKQSRSNNPFPGHTKF